MTEPNLKKKTDKGTEETDVAGMERKPQGGQIHLEKSRPETSTGKNRSENESGSRKELEQAGRGVRANPDSRSGQQSKRKTEGSDDAEPFVQEDANERSDVAAPIDERASRKRGDELEED